MRKMYSKPEIQVEVYQLDAAIAANCGQVISLGPEAPGKSICDEFKDAFEVFSIRPYSVGTPFYDDGAANCDCYYSSGGNGYFTS